MNKAVWLSTFFLAFFAMNDAQAIAINYPSKKTLQKADHILSLAMTAALCSVVIARDKELSRLLMKMGFGVIGVNIIANALMLKHEKSAAVAVKVLLPATIFAGSVSFLIAVDENAVDKEVKFRLFLVAFLGFAVNGIKNIWDIYSLARSEQSEGIQHD